MVNKRAQEALKRNVALRTMTAGRPKRHTPERRVKVNIPDVNGDIHIVVKECSRTCSKCHARFRCFTERDVVLSEKEWKRVDLTNGTGKTLRQWKERILEEMAYVDVKPYSHNIISIALQAIARGWVTILLTVLSLALG